MRSPTISAPAIQRALFRVLGAIPSDPLAARYAANAKRARHVARDADSIPRKLVSSPSQGKAEKGKGDGGKEEVVMPVEGPEEMDVVQAARQAFKLKTKTGGDEEGNSSKVEVEGRDVAAEYILRWARGDTPTVW